jgi:signal-transduction protein with cAMP-binding, CBS, and nucleotidyltransferase domain
MAVVEAIGRRAVQRLDELYRRTGATLTGESAPLAPEAFGRATRVRLPDASYLLTTLFFRHVTETELETIVDGCRCLQLPRGEVLERGGEAPAALWIVLRGAVETAMRDTTSAHRLRLAGPGRVVGHVGLLGEHLHVERRESRARELAIVLEIPWPRVHELMASTDRAARRFASALWTDTVRALQHGERPLARMSVHHGAPAGGRRAA